MVKNLCSNYLPWLIVHQTLIWFIQIWAVKPNADYYLIMLINNIHFFLHLFLLDSLRIDEHIKENILCCNNFLILPWGCSSGPKAAAGRCNHFITSRVCSGFFKNRETCLKCMRASNRTRNSVCRLELGGPRNLARINTGQLPYWLTHMQSKLKIWLEGLEINLAICAYHGIKL